MYYYLTQPDIRCHNLVLFVLKKKPNNTNNSLIQTDIMKYETFRIYIKEYTCTCIELLFFACYLISHSLRKAIYSSWCALLSLTAICIVHLKLQCNIAVENAINMVFFLSQTVLKSIIISYCWFGPHERYNRCVR